MNTNVLKVIADYKARRGITVQVKPPQPQPQGANAGAGTRQLPVMESKTARMNRALRAMSGRW